jgi:hypothetical protein
MRQASFGFLGAIVFIEIALEMRLIFYILRMQILPKNGKRRLGIMR